MEWVAPAETSRGQSAATDKPMLLHCLERVVRARGIKPALPAEIRAQSNLIQTDQRDAQANWQWFLTHGQLFRNSASNAASEAR